MKTSLPLLPGLDEREAPSREQIGACMHCGLCLEACPTYRELGVETDSPRGRIYLMKGLREGLLAPTKSVLAPLDRCLDCRACESACPSGVRYGEILEATRTFVQPARPLGPVGRALRWLAFGVLLPSRLAQRLIWKLLWASQRLGLDRVGAALARRRLLPARLAAAVAQAPRVPLRSFRERHADRVDPSAGAIVFPARGERRRRVALFTGCIADHLLADVNEATVRVLTENGCEVTVLAGERCCGALHIHNGARDQARALARANVAAFAAGRFDAIVSNAAGCSAELRHYDRLLAGDPASAEIATFAGAVRDVSELLAEQGFRRPRAAGPLAGPVVYDEPCHLLHAQRISEPPKALLRGIPGLELRPLEDAEACCGSAGLYSVLEPALAGRIAQRKIEAIRRSGAKVVATGNPGCLLQIRAGVRAAGLDVRVAHPVELLAASYERERGDGR